MVKPNAKKEAPEFEEVLTRCSVCGKRMKMIKHKKVTAEVWICQKCGKGEVNINE